MEQVYVVCWANASQDDDGNNSAFGNVHGVYHFLDDAKKGLEECRDEFIDDIINNPDYDEEDIEYAKANLSVYGSVEDDYFEIDYASCDTFSEIYINLVTKEIF